MQGGGGGRGRGGQHGGGRGGSGRVMKPQQGGPGAHMPGGGQMGGGMFPTGGPGPGGGMPPIPPDMALGMMGMQMPGIMGPGGMPGMPSITGQPPPGPPPFAPMQQQQQQGGGMHQHQQQQGHRPGQQGQHQQPHHQMQQQPQQPHMMMMGGGGGRGHGQGQMGHPGGMGGGGGGRGHGGMQQPGPMGPMGGAMPSIMGGRGGGPAGGMVLPPPPPVPGGGMRGPQGQQLQHQQGLPGPPGHHPQQQRPRPLLPAAAVMQGMQGMGHAPQHHQQHQHGGGGGGGAGGGRGQGQGSGQSLNPSAIVNTREIKNDYAQQFVDTGARPQNYLRDSVITDRYEEYPKLKELITLKDQMVRENVTPAYYLRADLKTLKLTPETFGTKFDVILIDPPWDEYARRAPHAPAMRGVVSWTWQEIMALEIENIADKPSFVFLWCGSAEGLDAGRHCLTKWGFKRVEDIVWIKTNKERNPRTGYLQPINQEPYSVLARSKEHCLMGLRGTLKRNLDGHYIHTNVDTDIVIGEEPPGGSTEKPVEMYEIIERFCLGKRRLELFGEEHNIRDGWVTVGLNLPASNFRPDVYANHFRMADGRVYVENTTAGRVPRNAPIIIPTPPEVEEARPKSPTRPGGR